MYLTIFPIKKKYHIVLKLEDSSTKKKIEITRSINVRRIPIMDIPHLLSNSKHTISLVTTVEE